MSQAAFCFTLFTWARGSHPLLTTQLLSLQTRLPHFWWEGEPDLFCFVCFWGKQEPYPVDLHYLSLTALSLGHSNYKRTWEIEIFLHCMLALWMALGCKKKEVVSIALGSISHGYYLHGIRFGCKWLYYQNNGDVNRRTFIFLSHSI